MAATNTLDGLFKEVYGDGAIRAVPQFAKLMKKVPFSKREKLGDQYVLPVILQHEHGFSYGSAGDGDFTLNAAIAGAVLKAKIKGSMIVLRSRLSYEDVFKASESGVAAFEAATSLVVDNMQRSFAKRQELAFLYGQQGIGEVASNTAGALVLSASSWAPGVWSGMKQAILEAFDGVTGTDTQHNGDLTVASVDFALKTVTVTGTSAAVVANDHLFFKGARTATAFKECAGIDKIYTNTGTLFNISAASYELWKANISNVAGTISLLKILNGVSDAVNLGLLEDAWVIMAAKRWNTLNSDEAALRRYTSEMSSKASTGTKAICYYSTNGKSDIEAHPFVKEGEAFLIPNPAKRLVRVGATDITFRRPGMSETIFRELTDNAGLELRAFSDQAIMQQIPAHGTKYTGITD